MEPPTDELSDYPVCKRCGACCYYWLGKELRRCRYLIRLGKRTVCRVYKTRIGALIDELDGKKVYCLSREKTPYNFPACDYNQPDKPMFPDETPTTETKH